MEVTSIRNNPDNRRESGSFSVRFLFHILFAYISADHELNVKYGLYMAMPRPWALAIIRDAKLLTKHDVSKKPFLEYFALQRI